MARGKDYTNFIVTEKEKICDLIDGISSSMSDYINQNQDSEFVVLYKYISHSDLATFGKSIQIDKFEKNILYYLTVEQMQEIQKKTEKTFETAHQSNIGLSSKFYQLANLPNPRDVETYLINDYCPVYLVNDNLKYFSAEYTEKILKKLNKKVSWNFKELDIKIDKENWITPIELSCAVHGLGTKSNEEFHKLRHHIFKSDTFIILFEKGKEKNNIFILLEKNPAFFSVLGEVNQSYYKYLTTLKNRTLSSVQQKNNAVEDIENKINEEITRQQQSKWRTMLAKEMMGYTAIDGQVFCPFTYITADFNELGPLFIASHIKGFSDKNTTNEEKYDLNNGLLLSANADALFDKHLISINENKELVFSYTLEKDLILKQRLCLMQPIFQLVLNEKRMEYLKYHKAVFDKLEAERKKQ